MELYNDQYNFSFSISRELTMDIAIMGCFHIPKSDLFHVAVFELQMDECNMPLRLPDITIKVDSDKLAERDNNIGMAFYTGLTMHYILLLFQV